MTKIINTSAILALILGFVAAVAAMVVIILALTVTAPYGYAVEAQSFPAACRTDSECEGIEPVLCRTDAECEAE